jgi:predicted GIY-YIG superfamily endonuclease
MKEFKNIKMTFMMVLQRKTLCHKLVYFEEHKYIYNAIDRENQLKKWRRYKKETLIGTVNPSWKDLSLEWAV